MKKYILQITLNILKIEFKQWFTKFQLLTYDYSNYIKIIWNVDNTFIYIINLLCFYCFYVTSSSH